MATIAELQIQVNSTQLSQAVSELNKFSDAAEKAGKSTVNIGKGSKQVESESNKLSRSQQALIDKLEKMAKTVGMTKLEMLQYEAEVKGVSSEVKQYISVLQKAEQAKIKESKAGSNVKSRKQQIQEEAEAQRQYADSIDETVRAAREQQALLASPMPQRTGPVVPESFSSRQYQAQTIRDAAEAQREQTRATNDAREALRRLSGQINPVSAAYDKLDDQLRELERIRRIPGVLDNETYTELRSNIDKSRKELTRFGATSGKTAKEIAFAMRGLPAQFTDIFVSLQGGQNPLTVFLQQGGQIKDMFGGIRPALSAMLSYVTKLITPFTLLASAVGVLGVSAYQGSVEINTLNEALLVTGNRLGTTGESLRQLASDISATSSATEGSVISVIDKAVRAGVSTSESLELVTRTALNMQKATGKAIEDTIQDFERIGKDPVDAMKELDRQYNFLDSSTYAYIQSLVRQGRETEAITLLQEEYARSSEETLSAIRANQTPIQEGWSNIKTAIQGAWDLLKEIGRSELIQGLGRDFLNLVKRDIDTFVTGVEFVRDKFNLYSSEISSEYANLLNKLSETTDPNSGLGKYLSKLKKEQATLVSTTKETNDEMEAQREINRKRLSEYGNSIADSVFPEQALVNKLNVAEQKLNDFYDNFGSNPQTEQDIELELILVANTEKARKELADFRKREQDAKNKQDKYTNTAAENLLLTLEQQRVALEQQLGTTEKLSKEHSDLVKFNEKIEQLKSKGKLTAEEKSLLLNQEELRASYAKLNSLRNQITEQERLNKVMSYQASLTEKLRTDQQKYEDSLIGAGLSDKAVERLKERNALQREYAEELAKLDEQKLLGLDPVSYDTQKQALQESIDARLDALNKFYVEQDALQANWEVGAKKTFENYAEAARNNSEIAADFFSNALGRTEDVLVDFVTTGKASFKDFATSILKELARIATSKALGALLEIGLSFFSFGGSGGGSTNPFTGQTMTNFQADGGAWKNGVQMFANGGAFTNSVVNKATAFSTGSGLGVMGEAGPEAIMPLTRTSDGKLGVQATGGAGTVVAPVSVVVNTESGATSTSGGESMGRAVQMAVKTECERAIRTALNPGGTIYNAMRG